MSCRILFCESCILKFKKELPCSTWQIQLCSHRDWFVKLSHDMVFDIAIFYLDMEPIHGIRVLEYIKNMEIHVKVIVLGKEKNIFDAVRAIKAGAYNYIADYDFITLEKSINEIMEVKDECNHLALWMDVFVKKNATNRLINLNMISEHFKVSTSYVSKLFSEKIGITFRKRLRFYRVQYAKSILAESNKPLYIIAQQSGFSNQKRLSETFVQVEGITPLKYRQLYQERANNYGLL